MRAPFFLPSLSILAVSTCLLACGGDDGPPAPATPVGAVLGEQILDIGPEGQDVTLTTVRGNTRLTFAPGAVAQRTRVTVRVSENVMKAGPTVAAPVIQIAQRNITFAVPVRARQPVAPPVAGRSQVAMRASEEDVTWVKRGTIMRDPVDPTLVVFDIAGSGLWAVGEEDATPDAGTDTTPDAGVDAALPDDGAVDAPGPADASLVDATPRDADPMTRLPQLRTLSPTSATVGVGFTLTVTGEDLNPAWKLYIGNTMVAAGIEAGGLTANVPVDAVSVAGNIAVRLVSPDDPDVTSNILYLAVMPAPGAPLIVDYSPDNGLPGGSFLLVGNDLTTEAIVVKDAKGITLSQGPTGTVTWLGFTRQSITIDIPDGMSSGPITVSNSKGTSVGKIFNVGQNLARLPGSVGDASTEYSGSWPKANGWDNNLQTSWFSAIGDCATLSTCTTVPWFRVNFAAGQMVQRIAMRGNREYASGYDFKAGIFQVLGVEDAVLWQGTFNLPEPDRDLDIILPEPIANARAVKFTSTEDESSEPGFAELEVFGPTP